MWQWTKFDPCIDRSKVPVCRNYLYVRRSLCICMHRIIFFISLLLRYVLSTYVARPAAACHLDLPFSNLPPPSLRGGVPHLWSVASLHDVGQGSFLHHPSIGLWAQLHGEAREFDSPAAVPLHDTAAPVRPVSATHLVVQCGRTEPRPCCRFQVHRRRRHCVVASRSVGGGQGGATKRRSSLY